MALSVRDADYKAATARAETAEAKLNETLPQYVAQMADAIKSAEAAEAALAAVPVDALRRTLLTGYRTDAQITADADAINAWLNPRE